MNKIKNFLLELKRRLYIYVFIDFILALILGYFVDLRDLNIKPISYSSVFIMLYPMLTGLEIEKVKMAGRNFKLVLTTITFAYFIASLTASFIARSILSSYPEVAFAMIMVGAIPCSNMLIGWSGIADASTEDALVIAVIGLLLIPIISPILLKICGGIFVSFNLWRLVVVSLSIIFVPLILGLLTRRKIIKKKGTAYFMNMKKFLPGISSIGILLIVFFTVTKVSRIVLSHPIIFLLILVGLVAYYVIQTSLSILAAKILKLKYEEGMVLVIGATASSQAISLSIAATMFSSITVFALSFKPIIQVFYIMFLIYGLGPWIKRFLGSEQDTAKETRSH